MKNIIKAVLIIVSVQSSTATACFLFDHEKAAKEQYKTGELKIKREFDSLGHIVMVSEYNKNGSILRSATFQGGRLISDQ